MLKGRQDTFEGDEGGRGWSVAMMPPVAPMPAVTAVRAQITVPIEPVPFTFQVLTVILSGLLLGPRYGALAQAIYVLVGAVGVPVFAGFRGGLGIVFGDTGGYLLAYPFAAAVAGLAPAAALATGVLPFVVFDLVKVVVAALVAVAAAPAIAASRT